MHRPIAFETGPRLFPIGGNGNFQISDIDLLDTWEAMTKLLATGKMKEIGVSNVTISCLKYLLSGSSVVPATNQVEAHPYLQQPDLLKFCKEHNILVQAYSPLGNNVQGFTRCIDDAHVIETAKQLGKEPAQLLISWAVQRGTCLLRKSVMLARIRENYQDFILPGDVMEKMYAMDLNRRQNGQLHWGIDPLGETSEEAVKEVAKARAAQNKVDFLD